MASGFVLGMVVAPWGHGDDHDDSCPPCSRRNLCVHLHTPIDTTMRITIKDGSLLIGISDLLDHLDPEDKDELLKRFACEDQVIRDVAAQLLDGCTEDGWHGGMSTTAIADTTEAWTPAIDACRRDIAKRSSEVAKDEIEALEKALKAAEGRIRDLEERRTAWEKARSLF